MSSVDEVKIKLLTSVFEEDAIGNQKQTYTEKTVFARIVSASSTEFWKAGQTGLTADYKAIIWRFEYHGEGRVEYAGTIYEIYRTYVVGDKIELHLRKAIGTQRSGH